MARLKMHALRKLAWLPDEQNNWTRCLRHVDRKQIAAFDEGVTCLNCLTAIDFDKECAEWEKAQREKQAQREAAK